MKVMVNGREIELEENDEVYVAQEDCDICQYHTTITVHRNNEEIIRIEK